MCGRSNFPSKLKLVDHYKCRIGPRASDSFKSEQISIPGEDIPILIMNRSNNRILTRSHWGFGDYYNARVETVDEKSLWRAQFKTSRCIIPLADFYEGGRWFSSDSILSAAAIFRVMISGSGERFIECSMITTKATAPVDEFHERMPVILDDKMINPWLLKEDINIKNYHPQVELSVRRTFS